jgi:hypothetical protein
MMKHEELQEVDVSRRKFLKLGGLFGLALGALSLPALGWAESTPDASRETPQEPWLEAKKKKKKSKKAKKHSAGNPGTDGRGMA